MQPVNIILVLTLLISTGCVSSQGFNRAAMDERLHSTLTPIPPSQPVSHQSARPSAPLRLGIFFAKHNVPDTPTIRKVEWLSVDRDQLFRELAPLREAQLLTDMFVLMDVALRGDDIQGIRKAGARFGADLVLVIDGIAGVDRYNNHLAWLYPTLIGAYLVPGTESDALVMATGNLWAVRSDWHAPIQTVEEQSKTVGAAVFVEDNVSLQEAKTLAIRTLGKHIAETLQRP
ncbi:MAG TPA: hypothetical protein PKD12_10775 [Nitrospira sp.]|nr:hypothetical protein [Nitrospira sp.]